MSAFRIVLSVMVDHEYDAPAPFDTYSLTPTPGSREILARRGFLWMRDGHVHCLLSDASRLGPMDGGADWLSWMPDSVCLGLESAWEGFEWVTPLPVCTVDEVLVYRADLTDRAAQTHHATGPEIAQVRPFRFRVEHAGSGTTSEPVVQDGTGRRVPVVARVVGGWEADLEAWGVGYYQVQVGREPAFSVLVEPSLVIRRPRVVLVVSGLKSHLLAADSPRQAEAEVRLTFHSTATVWRYHFFNGDAEGVGYLVEPIDAGDFDVPSRPPEFRRVPGIPGAHGEVSVSFESDTARPIPLRRRPTERFQLKRSGGVLVSPLPLPGMRTSRAAVDRAPCSEMIVHL